MESMAGKGVKVGRGSEQSAAAAQGQTVHNSTPVPVGSPSSRQRPLPFLLCVHVTLVDYSVSELPTSHSADITREGRMSRVDARR
ncbi:hypothetical protein GE061_019547 [Apolygus lucorum]|uniref:Uncharacterized protein n=1 Tax=Apolygus lucorum TaxID=248454 RepID=A0A8S9XBE2_APOLU|nr:hypothetical protein GE061_019547 [Apolygus lucorum]